MEKYSKLLNRAKWWFETYQKPEFAAKQAALNVLCHQENLSRKEFDELEIRIRKDLLS